VEGNVPWQVLVSHWDSHVHQIQGIKGSFEQHDISGNSQAFMILGLVLFKWVWVA
jgi:hypothetical protein